MVAIKDNLPLSVMRTNFVSYENLFELRIYKGSNHRCSQLTDNSHLISSSFKSKTEKEKRGKRMKEKKNIAVSVHKLRGKKGR